MLNTNIYPILLTWKKPDATGGLPLYLAIDINNRRVATKTLRRRVNPATWDASAKQVRQDVANADLINRLIRQEVEKIDADLMRKRLLGAPVSKGTVRANLKGRTDADFLAFCREQISVLYTKKGTVAQYICEANKIERFCGSLAFSGITYDVLNNYRAYMRDELDNVENTIWKSLKFVRRFCNVAVKAGRIAESPMKGYNIGRYTDPIPEYLEWSEVQAVRDVLLKNESLSHTQRRAGWHFIMQCCSGLRYSDVIRVCPDNLVREGRLILKPTKPGEMLSIKMTEMMAEAHGHMKRMPFEPNICNQVYNADLKVVGGIAGLSVSLASHMGRHSFGMRCAELDMKEEDVQKLMGHKSIKHTRIYFRIKDARLDRAMEAWKRPESDE